MMNAGQSLGGQGGEAGKGGILRHSGAARPAGAKAIVFFAVFGPAQAAAENSIEAGFVTRARLLAGPQMLQINAGFRTYK